MMRPVSMVAKAMMTTANDMNKPCKMMAIFRAIPHCLSEWLLIKPYSPLVVGLFTLPVEAAGIVQ